MIRQEIKKILEKGVSKKHFPGAHFSVIYKNQKPIQDYVGYKQIYPEIRDIKG